MSLFSILVDIEARTANFESGIDKVNQKLDTFGSGVQSVISQIAGFAAAAFSIDAIATSFESAAKHGEELVLLADRLGTTTESLTQLEFAARMSNVSFEALSGALDHMSKNIGMAADGTGRAKKILADLNLDAKELVNLPLDQQLGIFADKIAGLASHTEQAQVAMQLFGGEGARLLPFLREGADGVQRLRDQADALGITLGGDMAKKLSDAEVAIKQMDASWQGLERTLSAKVAPAVERIATGFRMMIKETEAEKTADKINQLLDQIATLEKADKNIEAGGFWNKFFGGSQAILEQNKKSIANLEVEVDSLMAKMNKLSPPGADKAAALTPVTVSPALIDSYNKNKDFLTKMADEQEKYNEKVDQATLELAADWDKYYAHLDEISRTSVEKQVDQFNKLENAIEALQERGLISADEAAKRHNELIDKTFTDVTVKLHKRTVDETTKLWSEVDNIAQQGAKSIQQDFATFLFDPAKEGFKGLADSFLKTIQKMLADAAAADLFKSLFGEKTVNGKQVSGLGGFFSSILGGSYGGEKAAGGPLDQGKWYIAGENGPEAIWGGGSGAFATGYGSQGSVHYAPTINLQIGANNAVTRGEVYAAVEQGSRATLVLMQDLNRRGKAYR